MKALAGLMSVVRHCPHCDEDQTVNYWIHDGVQNDLGKRVVRFQCTECGEQTTDLTKMDMDREEYVATMAKFLDMTEDEYRNRFDDYFRQEADA